MSILPNGNMSFSLTQRVTEHTASTPDALAVQSGSERLTYADLEVRSNQLAQELRSLGAKPETLIGIFLERSVASVISALAVLKAGSAYLPLDPTAPADRIAFMLRDSGVLAVITRQGLAEKLVDGDWNVIQIDRDWERISRRSGQALENEAGPNDLAYVIYTSGSTGQPKGVEIARAGLQNLVDWHLRAFNVTSSDRASLLASVGFDAAVWELWPYLAAGASVHVVPESARNQADLLRDWLVEQRITVSFVATPLAELLIQADWPASTQLRILLTGADTLHRRPPVGLPFTLVNNYGPTECTVVATSGVVSSTGAETKQPTIGHAIANTQTYILDEQLRQVPAGTSGELYIGGAGLARGYRNRRDLTAQKFLANPFGNGNGTSRLYRTGDRARFLPGGEIEFLGRLDDQIKIRGYRVELDEISSVLDSHPKVKASAVVVNGNAEEKRLLAYLVLTPDSRSNATVFRQYLQNRVPEYMIPAVFVQVEALPLTSNGKVDRAALSASEAKVLPEEQYIAPRTPVEHRLADLIAPLLRVERVGVNDNFFLLGGHSLLGTQLLTRISETFGVELSLLTVFDHPTLAGMSAEIEKLILAKLEGPVLANPREITGSAR